MILYTLRCDGKDCNRSEGNFYDRRTLAERQAAQTGWISVNGPGGRKHYCPGCAESRIRKPGDRA